MLFFEINTEKVKLKEENTKESASMERNKARKAADTVPGYVCVKRLYLWRRVCDCISDEKEVC